MNKATKGLPKFKSLEEEKQYWEARGPLGEGRKGRTNPASPKEKRSSFLSVRMSGDELTQLRDLAIKCDCGPSTLARRILVSVINQVDRANSKQIGKSRQTITTDQLCKYLTQRMPEAFTQKIESFLKSSMLGESSGQAFLVIDPVQLDVMKELGAKFMSLVFETANPNVRVITPYDSEYEKIKATLNEKDQGEEVKV